MKTWVGLIVVGLSLLFASGTMASKPQTVPPFSLTSESSGNNPNSPLWCLSEDDYDLRNFYGYLNGSSSTTFQLCDQNIDGLSAGGIGLESDVFIVGQLVDLAIAAPSGTAHHAELVATTRSHGVTTYHYAVCFCPPYSISTDVGSDPLQGGIWTLTLSGQITKATWKVNALMSDAPYQQTHCPLDQQNLMP